MTDTRNEYETPARPTLWLAVGFAILIALGVLTVMMPEVEDESTEESATSQGDHGESGDIDKAPQE